MKNHIKLFEEFNSDEFLGDFDIITFSISGIKTVIKNYKWATPNILPEMLLDDKTQVIQYKRSENYTNVQFKFNTQYSLLDALEDFNIGYDHEILSKLLGIKDDRKFVKRTDFDKYYSHIKFNKKIDPFINLNWTITFNENEYTNDSYRITCYIRLLATHKDIKSFEKEYTELLNAEKNTVEQTLNSILFDLSTNFLNNKIIISSLSKKRSQQFAYDLLDYLERISS